jgi:hypothetical protein
MTSTIRANFAAICLTLSASVSASLSCPANSPAELQSKFDRAFKAKDRPALVELFDWSGVDAETKKLWQDLLSSILTKEFIRSELQDAHPVARDAREMESRGLFLNVLPVASLYFERSFAPQVVDPREKTSGYFAIGKRGSCFVFGVYSRNKRSSWQHR